MESAMKNDDLNYIDDLVVQLEKEFETLKVQVSAGGGTSDTEDL
jgi:hypothetical protein